MAAAPTSAPGAARRIAPAGLAQSSAGREGPRWVVAGALEVVEVLVVASGVAFAGIASAAASVGFAGVGAVVDPFVVACRSRSCRWAVAVELLGGRR